MVVVAVAVGCFCFCCCFCCCCFCFCCICSRSGIRTSQVLGKPPLSGDPFPQTPCAFFPTFSFPCCVVAVVAIVAVVAVVVVAVAVVAVVVVVAVGSFSSTPDPSLPRRVVNCITTSTITIIHHREKQQPVAAALLSSWSLFLATEQISKAATVNSNVPNDIRNT